MFLTREQFNQVVKFVANSALQQNTVITKNWINRRVVFDNGDWLMLSRKSTPPIISVLTHADKDAVDICKSIVETDDELAKAFARFNKHEVIE